MAFSKELTNMSSKVSIIVPCYNQAQYLDEALQSVLDQTYINWECIIVNDGSLDNAEEVAKQWVEKDIRFVYLKKKNGGLSSARNAGIANAQGEFILPLDADDKIASSYVELAIESFQEDASLKVVYCKAEEFGERVGLWQLQPFSLIDLAQYNMIFCSAMYKKLDWELVGGYDVNMIYGLEDWEFWIAILKKGGNVKCLDEVGFFYRIKAESMIGKLNTEKRKCLFEYMSIKHADFFVAQLGSFHELSLNIEKQKVDFSLKTRSEKFLFDALMYQLFGITFFGNEFKRK
jgi:glycosyltransferase involved in cell wall biosynthesis